MTLKNYLSKKVWINFKVALREKFGIRLKVGKKVLHPYNLIELNNFKNLIC